MIVRELIEELRKLEPHRVICVNGESIQPIADELVLCTYHVNREAHAWVVIKASDWLTLKSTSGVQV